MPSNFPTKPKSNKTDVFMFPDDLLIEDGRNFCCNIDFITYTNDIARSGLQYIPAGNIVLPLPKKLNDVQVLTWEATSLTDTVTDVGKTAVHAAQSYIGRSQADAVPQGKFLGGTKTNLVGQVVGVVATAVTAVATSVGGAYGFAINPFLWLFFKHPEFKEHTLSWTFAPNNESESNTLAAIIRAFKFNSLPNLGGAGGAIYEFPKLAIIQFLPNDEFTFKFKPCAITSVQVDYSGGGMPSFFKNGAPTIINLTVTLKEIEIWTQDNYDL